MRLFLFRTLIQHQFKRLIRNESWQRNIMAKVLVCLFLIVIPATFLALGLLIKPILAQLKGDVISNFNSALIWYFAADLCLRVVIQRLPTMPVNSLLPLPFSRREIATSFILRSSINLFNLVPLLVVIPFVTQVVFQIHGVNASINYLLAVVGWILVNSHTAVLIQLLQKKRFIYIVIPGLLFLGLYLLELFNSRVTIMSQGIGFEMLQGNIFVILLPVLLLISILYRIYSLLLKELYVDLNTLHRPWWFALKIAGLDEFTFSGEIKRNLWLEVNLLLRNKRPRQVLSMAIYYLIYFVIILNDDSISQTFALCTFVVFISFLPGLYGQFLFSWESTFFDGIFSRPGALTSHVLAKYYLMCLMLIVSGLPFFVILSITHKIDPWLYLSMTAFTAGVTFFLILFVGTNNDGRIDLSRGHMLNSQGVKASQSIVAAIFIMLPIGLYMFFTHFVSALAGYLSVGIPGVISFALHRYLVERVVVPRFQRLKYTNLTGYRTMNI